MAPVRAAGAAAAAAMNQATSSGPHAVTRVLTTQPPPPTAYPLTPISSTTTTPDDHPESFLQPAYAHQQHSQNLALHAAKTAIAGGIPGAAATGFQITCFMWLQTTVSNQYRSGKPTWTALKTLWGQGGIRRLYSGYSATLLHGTFARFGDTAANAGMLTLFDSREDLKDLPVGIKMLGASCVAASWRAFLTPIEHFRMNMQTRGVDKGLGNVKGRVGRLGVRSLYHGSMALGFASVAQHFPWFCTFSWLNANVPMVEDGREGLKMVRHGCMGFASSFVSDWTSNFFKIMATIRITSKRKVSYLDAGKRIWEKDGVLGLFTRGLKTRIVSNGCQGLVFAVVWKQLEARFFGEYVKEGMGDPYAKLKLRKEREAREAQAAFVREQEARGEGNVGEDEEVAGLEAAAG